MKLYAFLVLGLLVPAGTALADRYLEAEPKAYALEGVRELSLDFPVGSLYIEGDDGTTVRVSVRVRCRSGSLSDCQERARKVVIDRGQTGTTLTLRFEGIPKTNSHRLSVEARLFVPRALATRIEMGVGDLDTRDLSGDLDVQLGVGDLDIRGAAANYRAVRAEVGVGDASVRTQSGRFQGEGFIGRSVRWAEGTGPSSVRAHVGVGDVTVVLD